MTKTTKRNNRYVRLIVIAAMARTFPLSLPLLILILIKETAAITKANMFNAIQSRMPEGVILVKTARKSATTEI